MKQRLRLFQRRGGVYYTVDTVTGKQASLKTRDEEEACRGFSPSRDIQKGTNDGGGELVSLPLSLGRRFPEFLPAVSAGALQPVEADEVLFTVVNPEFLWIDDHVPESLSGRIEGAKDALCERLDGSGKLFPISEAEGGRLIFKGIEVNPSTHTVPITYEMKNEGAKLRVGEAVRLHVETARAEEALAIPRSALVEEGDSFVAFVQVSG